MRKCLTVQYDKVSDNSMRWVLRKGSEYGGEGWPGRNSQMTLELQLEGGVGFHQAAIWEEGFWVEGLSWSRVWLEPWFKR